MDAATSTTQIGIPHLLLATILVIIVGVLSYLLNLGMGKSLLIGTIRAYVQLFLIGYVLKYIFAMDTWWLVLLMLLLMTIFATSITLGRLSDRTLYMRMTAFVSLASTTFIVVTIVSAIIIQVHPWYAPRYIIPLVGMILGNSMTGVSLSIERTYADLDAHADAARAMVALGATPWETSHRAIRTALRAGLMPTINMMMAVGIVTLPGMMSGQLLAGADPVSASGYQIIVVLMMAATAGLSSTFAVLLAYRKRFTPNGIYLEKAYRLDGSKEVDGRRKESSADKIAEDIDA